MPYLLFWKSSKIWNFCLLQIVGGIFIVIIVIISKERVNVEHCFYLFVVCQPGMFLDLASGNCEDCPEGQYQSLAGQASCAVCPAGFPPTADKTDCQCKYLTNSSTTNLNWILSAASSTIPFNPLLHTSPFGHLWNVRFFKKGYEKWNICS